jgi:REP element-mobilizing transposase RayT
MADDIPRLARAYLISFRTYGTWLHGDHRGSTDRRHNAFATPLIPANPNWRDYEQRKLKYEPVSLDTLKRRAVKAAVIETCDLRTWVLLALNVRTNHVHSVVSAPCEPERVLNALKANATRQMREANCWTYQHSPWSSGGSTRYAWTERQVEAAIDYVLNRQGPPLCE